MNQRYVIDGISINAVSAFANLPTDGELDEEEEELRENLRLLNIQKEECKGDLEDLRDEVAGKEDDLLEIEEEIGIV